MAAVCFSCLVKHVELPPKDPLGFQIGRYLNEMGSNFWFEILVLVKRYRVFGVVKQLEWDCGCHLRTACQLTDWLDTFKNLATNNRG